MNEATLDPLFELQKGLDRRIQENHPDASYDKTVHKRILALLVELGEFANETRCFKFWSLKGPSPKERIMDEYADALHFLLSIGLCLGKDSYSAEIKPSASTLYEAILLTYTKASALVTSFEASKYEDTVDCFLGILPLLGYTYEDAVNAYKAKLAVNYTRQDTNY